MRVGLKSLLILALIVVILPISLKLLAARSQSGPLKIVDHAITTAYRYLASVIVYPIDAINDLASHTAQMWRIAEKTQKLDEIDVENKRLKIEIEQLKRENASLNELLNLSQNLTQKTVAARIIGRITNPRDMLVLDRGNEANVAVGQAAVSINGLVGYISDIGRGWSKVTLITDPLCAVDAFVERSLERGIVRGYSDGLLLMEYLPKTADIKRQDLILTSGKGIIFPSGIQLGIVLSVEFDERTSGVKAVLKPLASMNKLSKVLIITQENKQ